MRLSGGRHFRTGLLPLVSLGWAALLLSTPQTASGQPVRALFTAEAGGAATSEIGGRPGSVRSRRMARVDRASLDGLREAAASGAPGRLRLNLFRDVEFTASLERSGPTASGYTLSGPLEDVPFGRVVLVVNGDVTLGRIYTPDGNYSIRTIGAMQTVERLRPQPLNCEVRDVAHAGAKPAGGAGTSQPPGLGPASGMPRFMPDGVAEAEPTGFRAEPAVGVAPKSGALSEADADDGGVVDVLVVYPSFVREFEGGYARMLSLIDLDIATANEAYAASGVRLRVRLAAAEEVAFDWFREEPFRNPVVGRSLWVAALGHLTRRNDGHLDEVHALRDRHAADLVLLHLGGERHELIADGAFGLTGGVAWTVNDVTAEALEDFGFSMALSGDGTFVAHELGHSMGLKHDRFEGSRNLPFPYSHGFRYETSRGRYLDGQKLNPYLFGTVMSQHSGAQYDHFVLAFSNPDLVHPHDPDIRLGVPGDQPSSAPDGPADAARHLNELRGALANVRSSAAADDCTYDLAAGQGPLSAEGGTHRLRVETQPGCAWTATGGEWVASVSTARGTGSADIEYRLDANQAFQRPVEVLVAGQVHARPQAGSMPVTPACDRSPRMRHFLTRNHPDFREELAVNGNQVTVHYRTPCEELNFDADYLASVRTLRSPVETRHDGLDATQYRSGDFDGLTGLMDLKLHSVESLQPGLLFGLTGLRLLEISVESFWKPETATLREIEPGAFRGLPGVRLLRIGPHRLERLELGMFEGLSGLEELFVERRQEGSLTLVPGAFRGLTSLRGLYLAENQIKSLSPGAFGGLGELWYLILSFNELHSLEPGVFEGLDKLETLFLHANELDALVPGAFDGVPELRTLWLYLNRLSRLPTGVLAKLSKLEELDLWANQFAELQPGTLKGLTNLKDLHLGYNELRTIKPGAFAGLASLEGLYLYDNDLRDLPPNLFEDLESLEYLGLSGNSLGTLRAGQFRGLDRLKFIWAGNAGITAIEPGAFDGTPRLDVLDLGRNRVHSLVPGALRGLDLRGLHFERNPGAPFSFSLTPVALPPPDAHGGGLAEFVLEAVPVAPFRMTAELSASGAALEHPLIRVDSGESRSHASSVDPEGDGPLTIRVDGVRWQGEGRDEEEVVVVGDEASGLSFSIDYRYGFSGFDVAPGPPLTLLGFPDVEASLGGEPRTFDLPWVFSDLPGGADYAASSDDGGVAAARVDGRTLIVSPRGAGTAQVTVTATGSGGEPVVRRFAVTVVDDRPRVPLFLSGSHVGREGFARVVNRTGRSGEVRVTAVDGEGARRGPATLRLAPHGAVNFNSGDLEGGNPGKGLAEGVGFGAGDWRLEFESDLEIDALAYVRTRDGFVTSVHDVAPSSGGVHRIATFNPASNPRQRSRLRVVSRGGTPAAVTVRGVDDAGASPGGPVRFVVPAGGAREFDAAQLESGDAGLEGSLGDGAGKWRLTVESDAPVAAMGLLESASTGHLTNLSSGPVEPDGGGRHHVALFPSASDPLGRQGFVRVVNRSGRAGTVRIAAFDAAGGERGPLTLSVGAGGAAHFNSDDLEHGAAGKGLEGSAGPGEGDWRLSLESGLDIGVLAYVRMADGFLTGVHDVLAVREGRREAVTFNPGSNTGQVSVLRVANPTGRAASVSVVGTDDRGGAPPHRGVAWFEVPAGGTLELDAAELEAGIPDPVLSDSWVREPLGDGSGQWRLSVAADPGVLVQSLLRSPTGHLTNLSTDGR